MSATPATATAPVYFDLRDRTLAERWKAWQPVPGQPVSLRGFDARSAERLYVRIDNKRSYLLYGDFQTGDTLATWTGSGGSGAMPMRSLGTYRRTATGLGWHVDNGRVRSNVFAIQDSLRQVIEFSGIAPEDIDGAILSSVVPPINGA